MKKLIIGTIAVAGYIALCRISRGYWNLSGDAIVIIMAAAVCLLLRKALDDDQKGEMNGQAGQADEPLCIRVAKVSGGIERGGGERIG